MSSHPQDAERYEVGPDGEGQRLDAWLATAAGVSRGEAQGLIEAGSVTVDGQVAAKSRKVRAGEVVLARRAEPAKGADASAAFAVAYEDDHLAVIVKPAGVVVHPAPGTSSGTLVEALSARMPLAPSGGGSRPGLVHRLDKDTSGLMVVAKTDEAYRGLVEAMARREVSRTYLALVTGTFALPAGRIEAPMGRSRADRTRMGVVAGGREAVTEFAVLEALGTATLIEVHLHTGRTHQIRVHLAHIHHPVVGDPVYGRATTDHARRLGLDRPFLHSHRLQLVHPVTGAELDVVEALPPELEAALGVARATA